MLVVDTAAGIILEESGKYELCLVLSRNLWPSHDMHMLAGGLLCIKHLADS